MVKSPWKAANVTLLHFHWKFHNPGDSAIQLTSCRHKITQPTLYLSLNTHCFINLVNSHLIPSPVMNSSWAQALLSANHFPSTQVVFEGGYIYNLYSNFNSLILFPSSAAFHSNSKPADNSSDPLNSNWHTHYSTITALLFTSIRSTGTTGANEDVFLIKRRQRTNCEYQPACMHYIWSHFIMWSLMTSGFKVYLFFSEKVQGPYCHDNKCKVAIVWGP